MDERAEILCRRIELHRHDLRQGVDAARAVDYLQEIADAEAAFSDADTTKALQAAAEMLRPGVEGAPLSRSESGVGADLILRPQIYSVLMHHHQPLGQPPLTACATRLICFPKPE